MKPSQSTPFRTFLTFLLAGYTALGPSAGRAAAGNYDFSAYPAHPSAAQASNPRTSFQTDEFTGSFGYQIPIELPPGRPGATPSLALSYGSGASNGWIGVGWSLDVGYIERDGRRGVPIEWAATGTVPYEPKSPLEYDHGQGYVFSFRGQSSRLVFVSGSEYRAEIDKDALKFILSATGWTVYAKDGSVHKFGFTSESANSRMEIPGSTAVANEKTFRWSLASSQDTNGNRVVYEYTAPVAGQNQSYLATIRYNGHTSQAVNAYSHTVVFGLEDRKDGFNVERDVPLSYRHGYRVETKKRLKTITTNVNGVRARQYELLYSQSPTSGRSLLTQVKEYGKAGNTTTAHPPIVLTYTTQSLSFAPAIPWGSASGTLLHQPGTTPTTSGSRAWNAIAWRTNGSANTLGAKSMLDFMDMDRDGLPDRVVTDQVYDVGAGLTPPDRYYVQHNTRQYFDGLDNALVDYPFEKWLANGGTGGMGGPAAMRGSLGWTGTAMCDLNDNGKAYLKVMDVNGDGYVDRVHDWRRKSSSPTLLEQLNFYVEYGSATGFGTIVPWGPIENHGNPANGGPPLMSDLVYAYTPWNSPEYSMQDCDMTGGASCGASGGGCIPNNSVGALVATLMDVNGDGLPDRVTRLGNDQTTERDHFLVQINSLDAQGHATFGPLRKWKFELNQEYVDDQYYWNNPFTFESTTSTNSNTSVGMFDVNGDGLPDRVMRKVGSCSANPSSYFSDFAVQYNKGYEFEEGQPATYFGPLEMPAGVSGAGSCSYANPSSSEDTGVSGGNQGSFTIAMLQDVNGDGLVDRVVHDVAPGGGSWTPAMWVQFNEGSRLGGAQPYLNLQILGSACNNQYPGPWHYPQASMPQPWPCETVLFEPGSQEAVVFRDVNGDSLPDRIMAAANPAGNPALQVQLATGDAPDLLKRVENGLGGKISVEYKPSTSWVNRDRDIPVGQTPWQADAESLLGSVIQTTWRVTVDDGINSPAITTYSYFGGMYDYADKEFRGFHKTTKVDASGASTVTWFHQDGGMDHASLGEFSDGSSHSKRGMPFRIESYDAQGRLLQLVLHKVLEQQIGSVERYFPYVARTTTQNYETLASPRTTVEIFAPVLTGTFVTNFGTQTSIGEVTGFNPSTHNYSTNVVATDDLVHERQYTTVASNAEIRDRVDFEYFRSSSGTILRQTDSDYFPTTGNVSAVRRWRNSPSVAWLTETYLYDTYGNVIEHVRPGAGTLANPSGAGELIKRTTDYEAPNFVFPWHVTDDQGTGTFNYVTTTEYDHLSGLVLTSEDWNGVVTRNVYDNFHRVDEVWLDLPNGGGSIWQQDYDYQFNGVSGGISANRIKRVVNDASDPTPGDLGVGHETYTYSDGLGRVVQARVESERTTPQLLYRVADTRYDSRGNVHKQTREHFEAGSAFTTLGSWLFTQTDYDALGRPTRLTPPAGDPGSPTGFQTTDYSFGTNPWVRVIKDGRKNSTGTGSEIRQYRDAFGRIDKIEEVVSGGAVQTTRYEYNPLGDLTKVIDHLLNETVNTYDSLGRRLTTSDPDLTNKTLPTSLLSTSYFHDDSIQSEFDGKGQRTDHLYDRLGRVAETKTYASGSSTAEETFSYLYDANTDGTAAQFPVFKGQLFKVLDPHGFERNGYDVRGHLVRRLRNLSLTQSNYTTQYTYDAAGRLATMTYPRATASQEYTYDTGGNLKRIQALSGTGPTNEIFYDVAQFDELRMPEQVTYGNGVVNTFTYYPNSKRLQSTRAQLGANPDYQNLSYTYDAASNVTSITDGVVAHTGTRSGTRSSIQYDLLYRLTSYQRPTASGTQTFGFTYDALGNMLTNADAGAGTYSYPASGTNAVRPHAVTSSPLGAYSYDDAGNMLSRGPAGSAQTLAYNARNLLTSVTPPTGSAVTYGYDASGARVWKQVGTAVTVSIGDHYEERARRGLCHVMAEGRRICTFQPILEGQYQPIEPVLIGQPPPPPPVFDYYHQDQLKTCCVMTNRDGSLAQEYQYTAYGAETYLHNTADFPLYNRYTDQYWDVEVGLYYYGARYYDPALGRFIQADTLTPDVYRPQSLNRYTYVLNNPFRYIDPSGHSWWSDIKDAASNFVKGAVLGDFAGEDLGIAGAIGSVVAGLSPLGVIADVRDFAAAAVDVVQGDAPLSALATAGAGLIPGVSEAKKVVAVVGAVGTAAAVASKYGDDIADAAGDLGRAARRSGDEGNTLYRYVGPGEAAYIEKHGHVPNVDLQGNPKSVSLTTDRYDSAGAAESGLQIGKQDPRGPGASPTHRVEVNARGARFDYAGTSATGGGIELRTPDQLPATKVEKLAP